MVATPKETNPVAALVDDGPVTDPNPEETAPNPPPKNDVVGVNAGDASLSSVELLPPMEEDDTMAPNPLETLPNP